ncbi:hypothetical protein NQ318_007057 [Aromia moschata]|uniref:Mos1 transposase HTH domain-containing protein n=1 Tax=Aromia moschata TaxID=1265417 RepID=A0AAV8XFW7_9CUCU|nr:hypothetical protein NQ318_007057 [Aromia moschata]
MASLSEQRAAVKFCFLLGKNAAETVLMLKTAYKDDAMRKTQVYEWFAWFTNGDVLIDGKLSSGRPLTARNDENVEKIPELVFTDRRQTVDQLSEINLDNRSKSAFIDMLVIPYLLSVNQKWPQLPNF